MSILSAEDKAAFFEAMFDNESIGILITDKELTILYVNNALIGLSGHAKQQLIGASTRILHFSETSHERFVAIIQERVANRKQVSIDYQFLHQEGHRIWAHVTGDPVRFEHYILWTATDITDRKELEASLTSERNYLQTLLDGIADPVMVIAPDYNITHMNAATKRNIMPEYIADLHHPKCYEVSHHRSTPCDGNEHPCPLAEVMQTLQKTTVLHTHPDANGDPKQVELIANPFFNEKSEFQGIIETARDVSSYLQTQDELERQKEVLDHQANHDALTGLPNRKLFNNRLIQAIDHARIVDGCVGVVFIDCDNFKNINDNLGHDVGDAVLKTVASRMQNNLRFTDTCSRLGGDEFTLILDNIKEKKDVIICLEHLVAEVKQPMEVLGHTLTITLSVGVATYPLHAKDPETLLKKADDAMYLSKKQGRNKVTFCCD